MNIFLVPLLLICLGFQFQGGVSVKTLQCKENEEYNECGTGCPLTCENYREAMFCTQYCKQGCFCKHGYVRGPDNKCVLPNNCPIGPCGDNEVASTCVNPCNDCMQKGNCYYEDCKRGCDCKPGYYKNSTNHCVIATECESEESMCVENEHYVQCVNLCNDCWSRGYCDDDYCEPGCDCKPGHFRDENGLCVPESQCISHGTGCGENEVYSECANPCNDCERKGNCRYTCQYGCDCKYGFYRNRKGACVPASQCSDDSGTGTRCYNCKDDCKENEDYYDCMPVCNSTCENYNQPGGYCSATCNPGCFCKRGLVKNSLGACVSPSECTRKCGLYEEYTECGSACQPSCNTLGKSIMCTQQCVKGCVCVSGYVRNPDGKCVKPNDCPVECDDNEEYNYCGSPCPQTCANYGKHLQCGQYCVKGCFCKPGFIKNAEGHCVLPSACPKICGIYEEYKECGTACPVHCANLTAISSISCPKICVKGCFCSEGYVRGTDGTCILPNKCPIVCGDNEIYEECGSQCEPSCSSPSKTACYKPCKKGCSCKPGYVRGPEGKCILPSYCPKQCGIYEEYLECGTTCPKHCSNLTSTAPCPAVCVKGCFCQEGYVRGPDGTCILPTTCPVECGLYEEYRECGTACPKHCSNLTSTAPCPAVCVKGCFCQEGYVRGPDGTCILLTTCPVECGLYEEYRECGTACPKHCSNLTSTAPCPAVCVKGCFCQEGYVRGPDGTCILLTTCPVECGLYEEYRECGTACPKHCSNLTSTAPCPAVCVKGCFCQEGYVRGPDGTCILLTTCPVECGLYEEYRECGTACPKHCSNLTSTAPCPTVCVKGCFCQAGYVRGPDGTCILPTSCPVTCGIYEEYRECGTACPKHCSNLTTPSTAPCPTGCVKGCFCQEGYTKGPDGTCILPANCPVGCSKKEVFKECGSACPPTCADRNRTCAEVCVKGCFCKRRYIRDEFGKCILPRHCPLNCKENEIYMKCGPRCESTCKDPHRSAALCPACKKGCFCKPGFVRGPRRKCILYTECPPECKENEEYKECGTACPATCANRTPRCFENCVKGCFCKPGYIKDQDGKCILPTNCPHTCNENEEYRECGTACPANCTNRNPRCRNICAKGCFCKHGYIKDKYGKCILPTECPTECGENEEFRECGPTCIATCENWLHLEPCPLPCVKGCFCKPGYVKGPSGKCILPNICPKPECPENESFKRCGPSCPLTCNNIGKPITCILKCVQGCFCNDGFVRGPGGKCVKQELCPIGCKIFEEYKCSHPSCEESCNNQLLSSSRCPIQCFNGCYCKKGLVRGPDSSCIPPTMCPRRCLLTGCSNGFGGRSSGSNNTDIEEEEEVSTNSEEIGKTKVTSHDATTPELTTNTLASDGTDNVTDSKQLDEKMTTERIEETQSTPVTTSLVKDEAKESTLKTTATPSTGKTAQNTEKPAPTTPVAENTNSISTTLPTKRDNPISTTLNTNKAAPISTAADPPVTTEESPTSLTTVITNDKTTPLPPTNKAADVPTTLPTVHNIDGLKINSGHSKTQQQKSKQVKISTRPKPNRGRAKTGRNSPHNRYSNSKTTRRQKPKQTNRARGSSGTPIKKKQKSQKG